MPGCLVASLCACVVLQMAKLLSFFVPLKDIATSDSALNWALQLPSNVHDLFPAIAVFGAFPSGYNSFKCSVCVSTWDDDQ